jgi:hypothetical protein
VSTVLVESARHGPRGLGVNTPVNTVPLYYRVERLTDLQRGKGANQSSVEHAHSAPGDVGSTTSVVIHSQWRLRLRFGRGILNRHRRWLAVGVGGAGAVGGAGIG